MKNKNLPLLRAWTKGLMLAAVAGGALSACSDDKGLEGFDNMAITEWRAMQADPTNPWITSVKVQLDVELPGEGDLTAQTIMNDQVTILGTKHIKGSGVMFVDVPQGIGTSFGLVYDDGVHAKQYRKIDITGENNQIIDVTFHADNTTAKAPALARSMAARPKAATNASLYGEALMPIYGYLNFGNWVFPDIAAALEETRNVATKYVALTDYEILARGQLSREGELQNQETILLSFIYGFTGQTSSRILGYYICSPNKQDIEFHDIADVLTLDYYSNMAKVQYQLDRKDTWYDANFDYKDLPGNDSGAQAKRRGDDCYNTLGAYQYYGERVTQVRGITFEINVPKGKLLGFYLKDPNTTISANQKTLMKNKGVPEDRLPKNQANYSYAPFNGSDNIKNHRSAMAIYDNFTFMGLDDNMSGGDFDCNDVTFCLSNAHGEKLVPKLSDETYNSDKNQGTFDENPEYKKPDPDPTETTDTPEQNLQNWTIGFENGGMKIDFDFNDAVLDITPNTSSHTATVYLMAAGAQRPTEVYYDERRLCEVHEAFGVDTKTQVNTLNLAATRNPILLCTDLEWPEGSTISDNLKRFSIRVHNEDSSIEIIGATDFIDGDVPQAICIAGSWHWPIEYQRLYNAYPSLGSWARGYTNPDNWNWYSQPTPGMTVTPTVPKK